MPEQMKLDELSKGLRAKLWSELYQYLQSNLYNNFITGRAQALVKDLYVHHFEIPLDEVPLYMTSLTKHLKPYFISYRYNKLIEVLEYILDHENCPPGFYEKVASDFENCRAAYRLNLQTSTFYPVTSEEQAVSVGKSLDTIDSNGFTGASEHLKKATLALGAGKYGDSIRESIHAVESVACIVTNQPKATLGDALKRLADAGIEMHVAFKGGLDKLYGYTSDERGVRHASLNDDTKVDEADALFMFGACASFCSYLIDKSKKAKLT